MDLPAGLTTRPLALADAATVTSLIAAEELHDLGEVLIEEADIVAEWQRPSFDLPSSGIAVLDGGELVAMAAVTRPDRSEAAVLPSHRRRGIGTWLAAWVQEKARSRGSTVVGTPVPQGSPADQLLTRLGYHVRWTSWVLRLPAGQTIVPQPLPEGYRVREARDDERRQVWTVVEDAFLEWSVREREPFEDFEASVFRRPGYAPWQVRVVTDPAGAVVGVAHLTVADGDAFVEKLAVRSDRRNRGLARALLVDAFAVGREHGGLRAELSTDSRTGALGLYEKVGMKVVSTWVNRGIDL